MWRISEVTSFLIHFKYQYSGFHHEAHEVHEAEHAPYLRDLRELRGLFLLEEILVFQPVICYHYRVDQMKKVLLLILTLLLAGAVWWNLPKHLDFTEYQAGRIKLYYVRSKALSQRLPAIAATLAANLASAERELGTSLNSPLKVYLYNDWEEKGNARKEIRIAEADAGEASIHCMVNETIDGTRERPEYILLLQQKYGNPATPERAVYAAAALSGIWNQKTLREWAEFLLARKLEPPLFTQQTSVSEFIVTPWSAIFTKFIRDKYGWDAFAQLYKKAQPPAGYEEAWAKYVAQLQPPRISEFSFRPEFQKGISYAYWNSTDGGYPTRKSGESLDLLRKMGVTWVASIPYGFMRAASAPRLHYPGHDIGGESDESLFALAADARAKGMKVMIKPQIWINHASWPGKINFSTDQDWNKFMDSYENWIVHYAIISELTRAGLLCIGTEMVQCTLKKPDRWRKLIARVRQVYHGPLVYASNYGKEFEELTFWDSLDYIGLDNYYAIRTSEKQGVPEMKQAFIRQKEKIRSVALRFNKPLLFTEIGYMANGGAGMGARESDFSDYNETLQAECYRLAMETYWKEPWFSGMYWWKWFSNPEDQGKEADTHSPHGRAAQAVLRQWYQKGETR